MSQPDELQQAVLDLVNRPNYQPVKPRVIAKKLGLSKEEAPMLRRLVKKMARRGLLTYGSKHLVQPAGNEPVTDSNQVTGVFRRVSDGNGYVRPQGAVRGDRTGDIFVPKRASQDAASGDAVLVKIIKARGRKGQPEGIVLEIIERENYRFVGTYFERALQGFVRIDGKLFEQSIAVQDPGAKGASSGDKVVVEMVRFPSHMHDGEGVLIEVLGPRGTPGVDTLSIIREFNLSEEFAQDVLDDAHAQAEKFDENIGPDRVDLTAETVLTIDPVDARDFDDAISLDHLENGHWLLGVHIADVAHFVRAGSPLDREARERATSVYLPDRVIPMLPEVISNSLASLQPDRVRYTKSCFIEFSEDGLPIATELKRAAIRSDRRFTYEEVDDFLAHPRRWKKQLTPPVHGLLERMRTLAQLLRERRMRRGALELSLQEVRVELDKQGRVCGAHAQENTESHQMIEEFMLSANEAVARRLAEETWPFIRRVHPAPSPRKLEALTAFVKELGIDAENLQNRFELQQLLQESAEMPQQRAVHYAVLRSLAQAVYSPLEEGHFALASDCYCHFTSPIRRYPDLTIHRLVDLLLEGKHPTPDPAALASLAQHCSDRERRAESAERELTKLKLLAYLSTRLGEEMDAVITGVESFGIFAQGVKMPGEGLIHVTSLQDDYYDYDKASHTLSGRRSGNQFRLGDLVRVAVAHVDIERRELDFRLVPGTRPVHLTAPKKSEQKKELSRKKKPAKKKSTRKKSKVVKAKRKKTKKVKRKKRKG